MTENTASSNCVLRSVSLGKPISRKEAEALWTQGKITGLFNLPSKEIFDACVDFCVEAPDNAKEAEDLKHKVESLQETNKLLLSTIAELKKSSSNSMREALLKEEEYQTKLSVSESKREESESHLREEKKKRKILRKELNAIKQECTEKLDKQSALIEELIEQNKFLQQSLKQLQKSNEEVKRENLQLKSPNQTEYLNKILLQSFINNMNFSANYQGDEEDGKSKGSASNEQEEEQEQEKDPDWD